MGAVSTCQKFHIGGNIFIAQLLDRFGTMIGEILRKGFEKGFRKLIAASFRTTTSTIAG
jgi:hypothetical protein